MHEPFEDKLAAKLEVRLGPVLTRWESLLASRLPIRTLAVLIFIVTALWWPCRLLHPQFLRFGFWETVCLDVMTVGPFAELVLLAALHISAARLGWPDRAWIYPAVICALSPLPVVICLGLIGGTGFPLD